jgi:transcriptional regulator with XRE-family HTH domain
MDADRLLEGLGQALRQRREDRGMTQEELHHATSIHRNYIGGIERGEREPTVRVIAKLGQALDVSMHELFARAEELGR